jgi:HSP20 family protein
MPRPLTRRWAALGAPRHARRNWHSACTSPDVIKTPLSKWQQRTSYPLPSVVEIETMRLVFPTHESGRLLNDVGNLFESFLEDLEPRQRNDRQRPLAVPMDVEESDSAYRVTLDVPGMDHEALEIDVHDDVLSIAGQRGAPDSAEASQPGPEDAAGEPQSDAATTTWRRHRSERPLGRFERSLRFPVAVDAEAVSAELSAGVLVVTLPKEDPEKGKRRIPISKG